MPHRFYWQPVNVQYRHWEILCLPWKYPIRSAGDLSDSADTHYESYVACNPSDLSLWSCCLTNDVAPESDPALEQHEFRVGGKLAKGPSPVVKFPKRDVDGKVGAIARRSLRLLFLLRRPETEDKGGRLLFIYDSDAKDYGRQGRRFIQELLPTQSLYRASHAERNYNRFLSKKGTLEDSTPAHEFNRLYKTLEHTAWDPTDPAHMIPFRTRGAAPYTCSEKDERRNQMFRERMQMWGQYKAEMQDASLGNPTHQFTEHPSQYNLHDALYDTALSAAHQFHQSVTSPNDNDNLDLDQNEATQPSPASDQFRAGSANNDFGEMDLSPKNQLNAIVHQVTSRGKLEIFTSSVASAKEKSYQSSWRMRPQCFWFRRIAHWFDTDSIGWDGPFLDFPSLWRELMWIALPGRANRYYEIRYMHLISGRTDLTLRAFRIAAFLKALKRKPTHRHKIPFYIDLLTWLHQDGLGGHGNSASHVCLGSDFNVFFLLYVDFGNPERPSIRLIISRGDSAQNRADSFDKSKNDQGGTRVSRTLIQTSMMFRPVRACSQWLLRSDWGPRKEDLVCPTNIRTLAESHRKFPALPKNTPLWPI